jgi:hypothetical protein
VARRANRKKKTLQKKLHLAMERVAQDYGLSVEDVLLTSITPETAPNLHQAVEENRVNARIVASVDEYDTLPAYGFLLYLA